MRKVADEADQPVWSPDGRQIALVDVDFTPAGLVGWPVRRAAGSRRACGHPPLLAGRDRWIAAVLAVGGPAARR